MEFHQKKGSIGDPTWSNWEPTTFEVPEMKSFSLHATSTYMDLLFLHPMTFSYSIISLNCLQKSEINCVASKPCGLYQFAPSNWQNDCMRFVLTVIAQKCLQQIQFLIEGSIEIREEDTNWLPRRLGMYQFLTLFAAKLRNTTRITMLKLVPPLIQCKITTAGLHLLSIGLTVILYKYLSSPFYQIDVHCLHSAWGCQHLCGGKGWIRWASM